METKIFGRLTAWQNWIFYRPTLPGPTAHCASSAPGSELTSTGSESDVTTADYTEKIPTTSAARRPAAAAGAGVLAANFLNWWQTMGPSLPTEDVYLRTAVNVGRQGWAHFGHVPMPDYRWGIFLAERNRDRRIAFGSRRASQSGRRCRGSTGLSCSA